ncbi:MAG: hypothetical protein E6J13_14965 [Chloroflexi bacterium]|nr:MAG: hypothetical protein E6J13_14965 [Chloroflexota bacterium]
MGARRSDRTAAGRHALARRGRELEPLVDVLAVVGAKDLFESQRRRPRDQRLRFLGRLALFGDCELRRPPPGQLAQHVPPRLVQQTALRLRAGRALGGAF